MGRISQSSSLGGALVYQASYNVASLAQTSVPVSLVNGGFESPSMGGSFSYATTGTGIGWTFGGVSGDGSGIAGPQ